MELKERGDLAWRKDGREKRTEEGRSDVELRGREKANFTFPGKAESGQGRVQAWEDRQPHRMQRQRRKGAKAREEQAPQRCVDSTPAARPSSGRPAARKVASAWASTVCRVSLWGRPRASLAENNYVEA